MKKKILSMLLIGVMTFGSMVQAIPAAQVGSLGGNEGQADEFKMDTGFQGMVKLDADNFGEEYQEGIDSTGSEAYNSEWDVYSSNYYYNMLSDTEREFWDRLDAMCLGYLTGSTSFTVKATGVKIPCYLTEFVTYTNMSKAQAEKVMMIFKLSNPQYYFLQSYYSIGSYTVSSGRIGLTVYDDFANGAARAETTRQFKGAIDSWVAQINAQPTDLLKEKKAHDMICEKVVYDPGYANPSIPENEFNQVAYSVFFTDSTVCAGYSQAMQILCNAVGIDCTVVTSAEHEWNLVRLDGAWYYVDLTWNDSDGWKKFGYDYVYRYFNRDSNFFLNDPEDVSTGNAVNHITEGFWTPYLPALTYDTGVGRNNVYSEYGNIHTPGGSMQAPVIQISSNGVTISSPSGGDIYYTTDGRRPSASSTRSKRYAGAFPAPTTGTVKAIAVGNGMWDSSVSEMTSRVHTVTFNSMGGSAKGALTVADGGTLSKPKDPTRTGYTFGGWYTNSSCTTAYNFSTPVGNDFTLYAKWNGKKNSVTFNANGGYIDKKSVKTKKKTVTNGKAYGTLPSPKRSNYVFIGWYTKKSGGSKIVSSDKANLAGKRTYYAQWSKIKTTKAAISSVKSTASGKMTVKVKNIRTASGYEIRYSLKSNMSSSKTTATSSTQKTISKLKKGKKYYVQVRMYQKESVSKKKYYGKWSSIKKVTIKK